MKKLLCLLLVTSASLFGQAQTTAIPYDRPPTPEQEQAITFMMNNLGNTSAISLGFKQSKLQAAGDKTRTLHPLRFFLYIFQSPKLTADFRKLRGRKVVWKRFIGDWSATLNQEADAGNMKQEYIDEFAKSLNIDPKPLWAQVEKRNWQGFLDEVLREKSQR